MRTLDAVRRVVVGPGTDEITLVPVPESKVEDADDSQVKRLDVTDVRARVDKLLPALPAIVVYFESTRLPLRRDQPLG